MEKGSFISERGGAELVVLRGNRSTAGHGQESLGLASLSMCYESHRGCVSSFFLILTSLVSSISIWAPPPSASGLYHVVYQDPMLPVEYQHEILLTHFAFRRYKQHYESIFMSCYSRYLCTFSSQKAKSTADMSLPSIMTSKLGQFNLGGPILKTSFISLIFYQIFDILSY